jgi:hypothetical protein
MPRSRHRAAEASYREVGGSKTHHHTKQGVVAPGQDGVASSVTGKPLGRGWHAISCQGVVSKTHHHNAESLRGME